MGVKKIKNDLKQEINKSINTFSEAVISNKNQVKLIQDIQLNEVVNILGLSKNLFVNAVQEAAIGGTAGVTSFNGRLGDVVQTVNGKNDADIVLIASDINGVYNVDGSVPLTGDMDVGGNVLTNIGTPLLANDAVRLIDLGGHTNRYRYVLSTGDSLSIAVASDGHKNLLETGITFTTNTLEKETNSIVLPFNLEQVNGLIKAPSYASNLKNEFDIVITLDITYSGGIGEIAQTRIILANVGYDTTLLASNVANNAFIISQSSTIKEDILIHKRRVYELHATVKGSADVLTTSGFKLIVANDLISITINYISIEFVGSVYDYTEI